MTDTRISAAGLDWHVRQEGEGADLVCIHGAGASLESWDAVAQRLADAFRVTRMDLPGHADTTPLPSGAFTLNRTAQCVAALCRELELESPVVLGHSAGGAIALAWAANDYAPTPGRLLAINPALLPFSGIAGVAFPALAKLAALMPLLDSAIASRARRTTEVRRLIEGTGSLLDDAGLARYQALMARPSHVRAVIEMMAGWRLDGLVDAWLGSGCPLDVLLGARDRAVPPDRTREALASSATMVVLDDAGHIAHEESPDAVAVWVRSVVGLEEEQECYG